MECLDGSTGPPSPTLRGRENVDDEGADGTSWVAIPALRDAMRDRIHRYPWLVRQLGRFPRSVLGAVRPDPYGLVVKMDAEGEMVDSLHDSTAEIAVHRHAGRRRRLPVRPDGARVGDAHVVTQRSGSSIEVIGFDVRTNSVRMTNLYSLEIKAIRCRLRSKGE
jgi:hypothetical protein